jgi:hypothetical protein
MRQPERKEIDHRVTVPFRPCRATASLSMPGAIRLALGQLEGGQGKQANARRLTLR